MEFKEGLFTEEFLQEPYELENDERAATQYWAAVNHATNTGLLFPELYTHLLKLYDKRTRKAVYEQILYFQQKPFKKVEIRVQIEKISSFDGKYGENIIAHLDELDLPDLYHLRKALLSRDYQGLTGKMKAVAEAVMTQINLLHRILYIRLKLEKATNTREANNIYAEQVIKGYELMKIIGHHIEMDYGDCDLEAMLSKPHAFLLTHQGSGQETYATSYMLTGDTPQEVPDNAILVKDALIKLPFFGELLRKIGATSVDRSRVQSNEEREQAIDNVVKDLSQILDSGRGIVVFPEGTRSQDGGIASTPKRLAWAQEFLGKLRPEIQKRGIPEILVLCDTMLAFPTPLEKPHKWANPESRINAGMKFKFFKVPSDLSLDDNPKDQYDQNNLFGFARHHLAEMQRAEIRKLLSQV